MGVSKIIGQNIYAYDLNVLENHGIEIGVPVDDTLYKHHVIAPEEPHSLEYLGSRFTQQRYWKDEGKSGEEGLGVPDEQLWAYCCLDCTGTGYVDFELDKELNKFQYGIKIELAKLAHKMTKRGLLLDEDERKRHRNEQLQKRSESVGILVRIAGTQEFNPGSNRQVARVLGELGFPVLRRTDTGEPSVDISTLRELERYVETDSHRGFLDSLRQYRGASKLLGTYIDGLTTIRGEIHPVWKAGLAETGRWRSSDPNGQNFPPGLRSIVRARPGYSFVSFDAAQLELRIIAHLANAPVLIKSFETSDPHELFTLALFYLKDANDIWDKEKVAVAKEEYYAKPAAKRKEERVLEKNFVYSQNYGGDWYAALMALRKRYPKIREGDVQKLCRLWHKLNPEIQQFGIDMQRRVAKDGKLDSLLGHQTWHFPGGAKLTEISNRPIQGAASDIMNDKILKLDEWLGEDSFIVTQEHDGIMIEVPTEKAEWTTQEAKKLLEMPVQFPNYQVTLPFDGKIGERWS